MRPILGRMGRREKGVFPHRVLPILLVLPQLVVTAVFFIWPTASALLDSFYRSNAFGLGNRFVGLLNFADVFSASNYGQAVVVTIEYSVITTVLSMGLGLLLAAQVDGVRRGRPIYRTLFIWPYAVPIAVSGAIWSFLFDPGTGVGTHFLSSLGINWNYTLHAGQAMALVIAITVWQLAAYNFLFFTAGLQAIPHTLHEAAALDGAGPLRRFWSVTFPLLSPTTFYLVVLNVVFVLFSTFGVIDIVTQGGPNNATRTLVYQVYVDAFHNLDTGFGGAETVLLILIISVLSIFQFRVINRRVHYQ